MDDLQNSQLSQLFPDTRPGAPAGSVDKQAIINDLMQLTADSSPVAPVGAQKAALRMSQSSEYALLPALLKNFPFNPHRKQIIKVCLSLVTWRFFVIKQHHLLSWSVSVQKDSGPAEISLPAAIGRKIQARHGTACRTVIPGMQLR